MKDILKAVVLLSLVLFAVATEAAVKQVNFTMSGGTGETATGFITYDDTVVLPGEPISLGGACSSNNLDKFDKANDNSIDYQINITSAKFGNVTFTKADCSGSSLSTIVAFCDVPDPPNGIPSFQKDVNFFGCSKDGVSGTGTGPNTFEVTNGTDTVAFVFTGISEPQDPDPIPTLSEWGMIIMSLILGAAAFCTMRRRSDRTLS